MSTNWRDLGDVPLETFKAELAKVNSPMLPEAEAIWNATRPHSALALAMLWVEQRYATYKESPIPPGYYNPFSQTRRGASSNDGVNRWQRFTSYADAATFWKERLTSPTGPYKDTETVNDLINIYAPPYDSNDSRHYAATVKAMTAAWPSLESAPPEKAPAPTVVFGRVPHPPYSDRPIQKPAGFGQDNLGQRSPKFCVLHRMLGSLWGTDSFFRMSSTAALTDYGIGVAAQDGSAQAGAILRWNDPRGWQSGWASGPVNGAYGDGAAIVDKYGVDAVNRDGVSLEISGISYDTPVDAKAFEAVAGLLAYWWDQMKIPHDKAPINPATGISAVIWHQEFTRGSGKICPGPVVMNATDDLIARATAILKQYQVGVTPAPKPEYAKAKLLEVGEWDGTDRRVETTTLYALRRRFTCKRATKVFQYASTSAPQLRAPLRVGETLDSEYVFQDDAKKWWVYTAFGSRVMAGTNLEPRVTVRY